MKYLCNKQKILKKLRDDKRFMENIQIKPHKDTIIEVKATYPESDHKEDFLMELNDDLRRMEFEVRYLDRLIKFIEEL